MTSSTDQSGSDRGGIVLAIELSNPTASPGAHAAALFRTGAGGHELLGSMPIPAGVRSADAIMLLVETLAGSCGVVPRDLTRIIVSVGPGGYTALRIATTTAKVLASALACELVAVPTPRVAARSIGASSRPALVALASKNGHAHCSIVDEQGRVSTLGILDAGALGSLAISSIHADAHLPESFRTLARTRGIGIVPLILDARCCAEAAEGIEPIEPPSLTPIYAREPDAVTQWRARAADNGSGRIP